jgi:hypothetical protein
MQEYGWFHWHAFRDMVGVIGRETNSRKMRLAACACVRGVWDLLEDPRLRTALEVAEDFADFRVNRQQVKATRQALATAIEEARRRVAQEKSRLPWWVHDSQDAETWLLRLAYELPIARDANLVTPLLMTGDFNPDSLLTVAMAVESAAGKSADSPQTAWELGWARAQVHCAILRDIFGNPFRPVAFHPSWQTETAVLLAKGMYESRDFGALPILADALQDAGCENEDILNHCRDAKQVHARGCWVVDLVLGKS